MYARGEGWDQPVYTLSDQAFISSHLLLQLKLLFYIFLEKYISSRLSCGTGLLLVPHNLFITLLLGFIAKIILAKQIFCI